MTDSAPETLRLKPIVVTPPTEVAPPPSATTTQPPTPAASKLPWIIAGLLAITTIIATVGWLAGSQDNSRDDVRGAAITFATTLTNWDARDGLSNTVESLRALGTGDFLEQIKEVLGDEARATAEAVGATSEGEILEVLVSEIEIVPLGDEQFERAVAIVIINQRLAVGQDVSLQEQIARIAFRRVDGVWLVEKSELLNAPTTAGATSGEVGQ